MRKKHKRKDEETNKIYSQHKVDKLELQSFLRI